MEIFSVPFYGSLKRYMRRRRYQRLDGTVTGRKNMKIVRFGGNARRVWKIRAIPKLRLKICSPAKILVRLREAYMDMMLKLAGNVGYLNNNSIFGSKRIPKAREVKTVSSNEEFEMRLVLEIYKSLLASRQLAAY
ncbi:PREDICTED: uncharacterized protein LOC104594383 [Nelumbo nucifera]|uniref:Uncharacterized protein LOC104594383 n=2 Tax=Nelumbo nucifera TaxID=4432 RepID=A0A1U7ZIU7_NELNU|nr:PREDICTED: uncharacterized protein LOC104594383 [Nelumbo nucifera]DAD35449.1 TPA_asm: hypothetical protein HUJ06_006089 [Nelumbo nucifera]